MQEPVESYPALRLDDGDLQTAKHQEHAGKNRYLVLILASCLML